MKSSKLEEIQQSTRVNDDGGGGVAAVAGGVDTGAKTSGMVRPALAPGDGAIGSRRREHIRGDDERGRSSHFDAGGRREMRVIGGGKGTQGSKEGGGSEQDEEGRGKRLPWTQIVGGRMAVPTGRRSGRLRLQRIRRRSR